jgi:signal transduction histidine kinase
MAISYRIVQEHGGRILVDSDVGRGTTITLSLPLTGTRVLAAEAVQAHAGD